MIVLCSDCYHYAPNNKEEFKEYIREECDDTMTTFLKVWKSVAAEHPELFQRKTSTIT